MTFYIIIAATFSSLFRDFSVTACYQTIPHRNKKNVTFYWSKVHQTPLFLYKSIPLQSSKPFIFYILNQPCSNLAFPRFSLLNCRYLDPRFIFSCPRLRFMSDICPIFFWKSTTFIWWIQILFFEQSTKFCVQMLKLTLRLNHELYTINIPNKSTIF